MSRTDEIKARLRNAPTIEATHAEVGAELAKLRPHVNAMETRYASLSSQVAQFASDRAELGVSEPAKPETNTGEPVPDPAPAAKPKLQGKKT